MLCGFFIGSLLMGFLLFVIVGLCATADRARGVELLGLLAG